MSFQKNGALAIALIVPGILVGQSTTQSIEGLVTDTSSAIIADAKVTITNTAMGVTSTVLSNSTGNYTFPLVPVGNYDVKAEMGGFKTEEVRGLRVETAAQVRQDFQLQIGAVTETVEVAASAVTLNTENASVGGVIENKRIIELPLNGRNVVSLAVLDSRRPVRLPHGPWRRLVRLFPIPGAGFRLAPTASARHSRS